MVIVDGLEEKKEKITYNPSQHRNVVIDILIYILPVFFPMCA